jgi:HEPN/RES N-terminal domain 1
MRKAEKRELMVQWFHQHYEDPAQNTSYNSAEGGYLWNHGGPYDAREELGTMFGDIVSQSLIEEVVEEVERDGIDEWAGVDGYEDEEPPVDASPFDSFTNHSTRFYGSPSDYEARERVHAALSELLASLDQPKPVGIGHNNPPEAIEPLTLANIRSDANELEKEFGKRAPSISLVRRIAASLYNSAVEITKWLGRKADLAVDVAIKTIVPAITVAIGTTHSGPIHRVIDEIISWLTVVAHKVM